MIQRPVTAVSMSRRALDRGALHVVEHAADAAELLAAAGAAGAAVHEHRQRRAVAGGLGGVVAVEDQDPAVPRREAEHDVAGDVAVVR